MTRTEFIPRLMKVSDAPDMKRAAIIFAVAVLIGAAALTLAAYLDTGPTVIENSPERFVP